MHVLWLASMQAKQQAHVFWMGSMQAGQQSAVGHACHSSLRLWTDGWVMHIANA